VNIAVRPINDRTCQLPIACDGGEDVSPDGGIFAATVVQYNYGARWQIIDIVSDRSRLFGIERTVKYRVSGRSWMEFSQPG